MDAITALPLEGIGLGTIVAVLLLMLTDTSTRRRHVRP